jgi:hypothetical protein
MIAKRCRKHCLVAASLIAIMSALGVLIWILEPPPLPPLIDGKMTMSVGDACDGRVKRDLSPALSQRLAEQFPILAPSSG